MTGYVVDASVAVKWLVSESYSDNAAALLEDHFTLLAPELIFAEATNALWAMHRRGDINGEDLAEAVSVLRDAPISSPSSMRQLASVAASLADELTHPAYDCFYLALALQEAVPVVTADDRFIASVIKHPHLASRIQHVRSFPAR